jgi:hypothetical protein
LQERGYLRGRQLNEVNAATKLVVARSPGSLPICDVAQISKWQRI